MIKEKYSRQYISKTKAVLFSILDYAEMNEVIAKNPAKYITIKTPVAEKKEKDSFTPEEIAVIEEECLKHPWGDTIYIMLNTGLRSGELLALSKNDINIKDNTITVCHSLSRSGGKGVLSEPKNTASFGTIPVSLKVIQLLATRILAAPPDCDFLFVNMQGQIINPRTFGRIYENIMNKIIASADKNIRYLPPHCCRHTFATRLYRSGADSKTIQLLMRHADFTTSANIYIHKQDDLLRAAIARL